MEQLLLVNPRRRRRKTSGKRRSAAQRRATARMLAANRSRRGAKRVSSKRRRRSSVAVFSNPAPKRRRRAAARSSGGVRRRRRSKGMLSMSMPSFSSASLKQPLSLVKSAAIGAVGAIAVNNILPRIPLPAVLTTGRVRYLTQGAAAIALGIIAAKIGLKGAIAVRMAEGSLTVTMADVIRDLATQAGVNLSGMGYYLPGVGVRNAVPSASGNPGAMAGMGKYISGPGSMPNVIPMRGMAGMRGFGNIARGF